MIYNPFYLPPSLELSILEETPVPLSISSNLTDIITTNEYESEIELPKNNPILSSLLPSSGPHSMILDGTPIPFNADTPKANNPGILEGTPNNNTQHQMESEEALAPTRNHFHKKST